MDFEKADDVLVKLLKKLNVEQQMNWSWGDTARFSTTSQDLSMIANVIQEPSPFQFLTAIEADLACRTRLRGSGFCGDVPHRACYPRKPRGGSVELETKIPTMRQSLCCDKCKRRTTPESVRFLGRRVYPGFIMVFAEWHAVRRYGHSD